MSKYAKGREQVYRDLERIRDLFDMRSGSLGKTLCQIATDGIQDNLDSERDAEGNAFAPLSPKYAAYKASQYPGQPIAVLHHLMVDPAQVTGLIEVDRNEATVTYGVSQDARQEAAWFIEGDPERNRPPRNFWGLTPEATQLIDETLEDRLELPRR